MSQLLTLQDWTGSVRSLAEGVLKNTRVVLGWYFVPDSGLGLIRRGGGQPTQHFETPSQQMVVIGIGTKFADIVHPQDISLGRRRVFFGSSAGIRLSSTITRSGIVLSAVAELNLSEGEVPPPRVSVMQLSADMNLTSPTSGIFSRPHATYKLITDGRSIRRFARP